MTEQQEQYTEIEKEAQKWLDETDTMQFSQMELLTMFAAHQKVKNNDLLHDVVGSEFTDCIKTVVHLKDETTATVYVPKKLNATEHLNYYDQIFTVAGWWTWSKVN